MHVVAHGLADPPRVFESSSGAFAALEIMRSSVAHRRYDDIIVLDPAGRCAGTVAVGDLIQGVAKTHFEHTAVQPLTRLAGSDMGPEPADPKVADGVTFAAARAC